MRGMIRGLGLCLLLGSLLPGTAEAQLPAFPECRGWGCEALDAPRGTLPVQLLKVTNTNDSGAGSLRDVLDTAHPDSITFLAFTTGGRICLQSELVETGRGNNLYIAGQTAPGGGIVLACSQFRLGSSGAENFPSDIVLRYLNFRKNNRNSFPISGPVAFDHLGCAWSGVSGSGGSDCFNPGAGEFELGLITFSNSIAFEPDAAHPTVLHINPHFGTVHSNLLMGPGRRFPWTSTNADSTGGLEVVNNLVYNWSTSPIATVHTSIVDIEWNTLKSGPATPTTGYISDPIHWRVTCGAGPELCLNSVYINNNLSEKSGYEPLPADSAWRGSQRQYTCDAVAPTDFPPDATCEADGDTVPEIWRRNVDLPTHLGTDATWPYHRRRMSPALEELILADVGNTRGLTCSGRWYDRRDSLDEDKIQEYRDGTGLDANIDFTGSDPDTPPIVPIPSAGASCTDTDDDIMPDIWEFIHCGGAQDCRADSVSVSGYLMIEHYFNGSDPADPAPQDLKTFSNGRYFYIADMIELPFGSGTIMYPDTAVVQRGEVRAIVHKPETFDMGLIMTCDEQIGVPLDSLNVQQLIDMWQPYGVSEAATLRNRPLFGVEC